MRYIMAHLDPWSLPLVLACGYKCSQWFFAVMYVRSAVPFLPIIRCDRVPIVTSLDYQLRTVHGAFEFDIVCGAVTGEVMLIGVW
jgi:hypothetical protein